MASEMLRPDVIGFMDNMMRSEFAHRLEEIFAPASLNGKTIAEFPIEDLNESLILAVRRDDQWSYSPKGDFVVNSNDLLVFLTTPEERRKLKERLSNN